MKSKPPKDEANSNRPTYYDRLTGFWKNTPILVWVVFLSVILAGLASALSNWNKVQSVIVAKTPGSFVDINMRPFNPFYSTGGKLLHSGGGIPAIFLETATDSVWEVAIPGSYFGRPAIQIDMVYNAPADAPVVIIREIGIKVRPTTGPANGHIAWYSQSTGASATPGIVEGPIKPTPGHYPLTYWGAGEQAERRKPGPPPKLLQYIKPSEPISFEAELLPQALDGSATILSFYAKVLIGGKEEIIESKNGVRFIFLDKGIDTSDRSNKRDAQAVQKLRNKAYVRLD